MGFTICPDGGREYRMFGLINTFYAFANARGLTPDEARAAIEESIDVRQERHWGLLPWNRRIRLINANYRFHLRRAVQSARFARIRLWKPVSKGRRGRK